MVGIEVPAARGVTGSGSAAAYSGPVVESIRPYPPTQRTRDTRSTHSVKSL